MAASKTAQSVAKGQESSAVEPMDFEEVQKLSRQEGISDAEARSVKSYEDAFALAERIYGDTVDVSEELGNGFTLISDKSSMVGKPMLILSIGFNEGTFGEFVSVAAVTKDGGKYIFNDGSSGVYSQLFELARTHNRTGGYVVNNGLRASEYDTCSNCNRGRSPKALACQYCGDESEKRGKATTYYLDLSPAE